ncbi:MAG: hypothetical protein ABSA74_03565 [Candidatus Staskawiczbacteria bacterium]|jgi:hypothetical protein
MTTAVLNYLKVQKKIQAKVESVSLPAINWKMICVFGFFVSLALLIFYVLQINYLTAGYYITGSYENQISKLSDENKNLQVSFAENSFLGQVSEKAQALNFQKVTSVKYIQILDNSVALGPTAK